MKSVLRVFPRRTAATPTDALAFVGEPPLAFMRPPAAEVAEVRVSVTMTWDIVAGLRLGSAWANYYDVVHVGGPALGSPAGEFEPCARHPMNNYRLFRLRDLTKILEAFELDRREG